MKGFAVLAWRSAVIALTALLVAGAGMVVNDGTKVSAANTITVQLGAVEDAVDVQLYLPRTAVVNEGDTIEFVNPFVEPHTVTYIAPGDASPFPEAPPSNVESTASFDGTQSFNSSLFLGGDSFSVTFTAGGTYQFLCLLHPGMLIDVTVVSEGVYVPPQGSDDPSIDAIVAEGLAIGEAASADAAAEVAATNAGATNSWAVLTAPSVPYLGGSVDVMRFLPQTISIGAGDTVTWTNTYGIPHTITFLAGPPPADFDPFEWDVPNDYYDPSKLYSAVISVAPVFGGVTEFSLSFPTPGTYEYICVLHADQGMVGTIEVGPPGSGTGGGATITPPSTGSAGLMDQSTGSWMMIAGLALLGLGATAGVAVAVRISR